MHDGRGNDCDGGRRTMDETAEDNIYQWPHVDRRKRTSDRRREVCDMQFADLDHRCKFCERAIGVISATIAVIMLALGGMGVWSWYLQEHVSRAIQANANLIIENRGLSAEAHGNLLGEIRMNRAMSEKNRDLITQAIAECTAQARGR